MEQAQSVKDIAIIPSSIALNVLGGVQDRGNGNEIVAALCESIGS